jgi:outer membrane protein OmpA-like peptidoglycan-associated protein
MLGAKVTVKRIGKDDGEKPFWISFSDLMTALMVVFLLVMSVALLSVTKDVTAAQKAEAQRREDIKELLAELKKASERDVFSGVTVHDDLQNPYIDFGWLATFDLDRSYLTRGQATFLRAFIPEILAVADTEKGRHWFKQVVVEGYTDKTGQYLHNLDLSLRRSERVVCVLLETPGPADAPLTDKQKVQVRHLFLVGGYSSNSAKADAASSRRIELKLKFWELNDSDPRGETDARDETAAPGSCELGVQ